MDCNHSMVSHTQKFHLRNSSHAAIEANLATAIKKGNVRSFIQKGIGSSRETAGPGDDQENTGLDVHLLQLKNSCCDLSRQIKSQQSQTCKFKDQAHFAHERRNKIKEERQELEDKISQLQKKLDQVSSKRDSAFHCSKTYEHILERMKKDSIHHQLKKNQMGRSLRTLEKQTLIVEGRQYSAAEVQKLSTYGIKDAQEQFEELKEQRKKKLEYISQLTAKKKEHSEKLRERQNKTEQIQQMAAGDLQDADLLRLKKFLTVQMFLKQLLKSKASRMKEYFQHYELAFYQIKSRTHIQDASSLKNDFFNFENSYTEKTEWVKILETEISEADQERSKLREKLEQLSKKEIEALEEIETRQQQKIPTIDRKQLQKKSIQYELAWEKIKSWLGMQGKKIGIDSSQSLGEVLKKICQGVKQDKGKRIKIN